MSNSPILAIPEISPNQNNKSITHNNAIVALEAASNDTYENSSSGSSDITINSPDSVRYHVYDFQAASADRNVIWPDEIDGQTRKRVWVVKNSTGFTLTMKSDSAGDEVDILPGNGAALHQVGADIYAIGFFELVGTGKSYDVGLFIPGKPDPSSVITQFTAARTFALADDFAGSVGSVTTPPSTTMTLDVFKNASKIGEVAIDNAGAFTFTTTGGSVETFVAGDKLIVKTQVSVPTAVFDISITLRGTR